jgi:hypothetical protein
MSMRSTDAAVVGRRVVSLVLRGVTARSMRAT